MTTHAISKNTAQRGFTLIELMIGLLLGMLTVLVISQVLALSEGKKRSITTGSDAQVNGALSLFTLQRDIQQAGYGAVSSPDAMGCQVKGQYQGGSAFTLTLAPVTITSGASGGPDTITVLQGKTASFSTPIILSGNHASADTAYIVTSSFGAVAGNMMIAVPKVQGSGTWCTLFNVTDDTSSPLTALGPTRIPNASGDSGKWNHTSLYPTAGYAAGDYLLNMGSMVSRVYSINSNNNLQLAELSPDTGATSSLELYPEIVNLKAFYGKDTNGDGLIDLYDAATPTTNAGWKQVLAIRIALVARSNQFEKDAVTPNPPEWDVGATTFAGVTPVNCRVGSSKCIRLPVVNQVGEQWQQYRYKIYDTIVPLRNVLWNS
jgi:type IV pilus assembly protein PilW